MGVGRVLLSLVCAVPLTAMAAEPMALTTLNGQKVQLSGQAIDLTLSLTDASEDSSGAIVVRDAAFMSQLRGARVQLAADIARLTQLRSEFGLTQTKVGVSKDIDFESVDAISRKTAEMVRLESRIRETKQYWTALPLVYPLPDQHKPGQSVSYLVSQPIEVRPGRVPLGWVRGVKEFNRVQGFGAGSRDHHMQLFLISDATTTLQPVLEVKYASLWGSDLEPVPPYDGLSVYFRVFCAEKREYGSSKQWPWSAAVQSYKSRSVVCTLPGQHGQFTLSVAGE